MDNRKERIQPAVRKETEHVMVYTAAGVAVMWCVFLALHLVMPEKVPFDYTVILGGLFGGAVAVLNFFLMGMAVQKAAAETEEAAAKRWIQASYSQRNMMQMLWVILTSLFSVCSWNPSTSDSWNSNQTGESSERKIRR